MLPSANYCAAGRVDLRVTRHLLMSGATIRHGGGQAYYRPSTDEIQLPPRQWFPGGDSYYATALHELTHWTASPGRCNRQLGHSVKILFERRFDLTQATTGLDAFALTCRSFRTFPEHRRAQCM